MTEVGRERPDSRTRTAKVSEVVARAIVADIVDRGIEPGTVLDKEAEMVSRFGVSRSSVREALRILEIAGLITMKSGPGGGPIVADANPTDFAKMSALYLQFLRATYSQLVEAQLHVEPFMARLAAHRRDEHQLEKLGSIVEQTRELDLENTQRYVDLSRAFHDTVSRMSGNSILDLFAGGLKEMFIGRLSPHAYIIPAEERSKAVEAHCDVADAIISGDGDAAEARMHAHMAEYRRHTLQQLPDLTNEIVQWS